MTIFRARFESTNFEFEAYGSTKTQALLQLQAGLAKHSSQYNCRADWWRDYEDDISVTEIRIGACYRDHELLVRADETQWKGEASDENRD